MTDPTRARRGASPLAGKTAAPSRLVDVPRLVTAYYVDVPDPAVAAQRVTFGTSGHRGSSLERTFNEPHVLAISQAICDYRTQQGITGPLYLGIDTHALSVPARASALEVLAANGVEVMLAVGDEFTPTPVISHAIVAYNRGRDSGRADGIVVTPSHNPPGDGGFKYNTPDGGPADTNVTRWIECRANALLSDGLRGVKRMAFEKALRADTTHRHDYLNTYVGDLENVIDLAAIRDTGVRMGVDPLGGAGVHYWPLIAERYRLNLTVVNSSVDPTFRFMNLDWDGRIRMDPSSPFAMRHLILLKRRFDVAFACDTDHDRHGIVTHDGGLLSPNHYLPVALSYLLQNRPRWRHDGAVGKSVVTTRMLDLVAAKFGRGICEVPVGFKWFASGLLDGSLCFAGEESAGATFARLDGRVWTTDKDGIVPALLSAEIIARTGRDPAALYEELVRELGEPFADRLEAPASAGQKARLASLSASQVQGSELAGDPIDSVLDHAPGNGAPFGGIKVSSANGWFAARPSGTENLYKIYAESFKGQAHLRAILREAQVTVDEQLGVG